MSFQDDLTDYIHFFTRPTTAPIFCHRSDLDSASPRCVRIWKLHRGGAGHNIPYIISFTLFVILCVPTALADSYASLLVLRFLTGFMGSPALATGGATMQDMVSFH